MKFPLLGGACLQALLLMSLVMEGCDGKVIGRSKHPAPLSVCACRLPFIEELLAAGYNYYCCCTVEPGLLSPKTVSTISVPRTVVAMFTGGAGCERGDKRPGASETKFSCNR